MILLLLTFILLSSIFHSIDQIKCNRSTRTWLPRWIWSSDNWFDLTWIDILDGFHIFKGLNRWCFLTAGYCLALTNYDLTQVALISPVIWALDGRFFNLFYHVVWMRPKYREWDKLNIL